MFDIFIKVHFTCASHFAKSNTLCLSGLHNPELPHPIVFRGAIFADNARFDRCIDLWLHALKLRQLNDISIVTDLLRFAQVFSQMIHVGVDLDISQVINVLEASVTELSRNKIKIQKPDSKDDIDQCIVSSIKGTLICGLSRDTVVSRTKCMR